MDYMEMDLKREAAVGAGEYVQQRTHTVSGLNKPELNSILTLKYCWYDQLVEGLQAQKNVSRFLESTPNGFPAEKRTFADLSGVPKVQSTALYTKDTTPRFV
jgi:hypothetical protein